MVSACSVATCTAAKRSRVERVISAQHHFTSLWKIAIKISHCQISKKTKMAPIWSALDAIDSRNFKIVEAYLSRCSQEELSTRYFNGETLLHKAVGILLDHWDNEDCRRIVVLLTQYVDGRIRNSKQELAVHTIFKCENKCMQTDCVQNDCMHYVLNALLDQTGVLSMCYQDQSLLLPAIKWSKWSIVQGIIMNETSGSRYRSLQETVMWAICSKDVFPSDDILNFLRRFINMRDEHGYRPLMKAAEYGTSQCIIKLVKHGADVTRLNKDEESALYQALTTRVDELTAEAYTALMHRRVINKTPSYNRLTPLHIAAGRGANVAILALVKAGADITRVCCAGYTALHYASQRRHFPVSSEAFEALIDPSIINLQTKGSLATPLHCAAYFDNGTAVEALVKAGADLTLRNCSRETPFEEGLKNVSDTEVVCKLVPRDVYLDSHVIFSYLCRNHTRLFTRTKLPELLARTLVVTKRDDFFHLHPVRGNVRGDGSCMWFLQIRGLSVRTHELKEPMLQVICQLVRKGLWGRTRPQCSEYVAQFSAQQFLVLTENKRQKIEAKLEEVNKESHELDSLFDNMMSLREQSAFAIRRSIQGPKYENIHQLPLPQLLKNYVSLLDLGREICDLVIQYNITHFTLY